MRKRPLTLHELTDLANTDRQARVSVADSGRQYFASGRLLNLAVGPWLLLSTGSLRGLAAMKASVQSSPAVTIELRLAGQSASEESQGLRRAFRLKAGHMLVLGSNRDNEWRVAAPPQADFDTVSFAFLPEMEAHLQVFAPALAKGLTRLRQQEHQIQMPMTPDIALLAQRCLTLKADREDSRVLAWAWALELLQALSRLAPLRDWMGEQATTSGPSDRLQQALEFIRQNPTIRLKPSDVARHCLMATSSLHRLFADVHHSTVANAIRHQALLQAHALIRGGVPVNQVAKAVGYATPEAFARAFRAQFGVNPSAVLILNN